MIVFFVWDDNSFFFFGLLSYNDIWGYIVLDGWEYVILGNVGIIVFFDIISLEVIVEVGCFFG